MFRWISSLFDSPVVECKSCDGVGWNQSGESVYVSGVWPPRMVYPVRECLICDGTGRVKKEKT